MCTPCPRPVPHPDVLPAPRGGHQTCPPTAPLMRHPLKPAPTHASAVHHLSSPSVHRSRALPHRGPQTSVPGAASVRGCGDRLCTRPSEPAAREPPRPSVSRSHPPRRCPPQPGGAETGQNEVPDESGLGSQARLRRTARSHCLTFSEQKQKRAIYPSISETLYNARKRI